VPPSLAAEMFSRSGLCGLVSELLVNGDFRPPAMMDFRYRKVLVREFFSCAAPRFVAINVFVKSKQIYF